MQGFVECGAQWLTDILCDGAGAVHVEDMRNVGSRSVQATRLSRKSFSASYPEFPWPPDGALLE